MQLPIAAGHILRKRLCKRLRKGPGFVSIAAFASLPPEVNISSVVVAVRLPCDTAPAFGESFIAFSFGLDAREARLPARGGHRNAPFHS